MNKFFIDSDVFLDIFLDRIHFAKSAALFYDLCTISKEIQLYTTSICISNIHYIYSKQIGIEKSRMNLLNYKSTFSIITTSDAAVENALKSTFRDLEDALKYYSCLDNDIDLIITRNKKDYIQSDIPIVTPAEFLRG